MIDWLEKAIELKAPNLTVSVAHSCLLMKDDLDLLLGTYHFALRYDQELKIYLN